MQEITILAIYIFILLLTAARFLSAGKVTGRVMRRFRVGRAMTIGTRQVQEDNYGICQGPDAFMAVLADGMGKNYGGKVSSRIAVETMKDLFPATSPQKILLIFSRGHFMQRTPRYWTSWMTAGAAPVWARYLSETVIYTMQWQEM